MNTPTTIPEKKSKKLMSKAVKIILFILLGVIVICVVIGIISSSTPSGKATATARAIMTQSAVPAATLAPSDVLVPQSTNTPAPTETQLPLTPTKTQKPPTPIETQLPPTPTKTQMQPTPTYEPIILAGSGDSVVDFSKPFDDGILHVTGNSSSRYFGVESYNSNGDKIELLVNTTDPYDGIVPLDFNDSSHTSRFQVKAEGNWTIEVLPLSSAHVLVVPGTITGKGDDVIILKGSTPDLAKIKGNSASRYFGVFGYSNYNNLLVNTTDPYDGTVILESDTLVLEIKAVGDWSIEVTGK